MSAWDWFWLVFAAVGLVVEGVNALVNKGAGTLTQSVVNLEYHILSPKIALAFRTLLGVALVWTINHFRSKGLIP